MISHETLTICPYCGVEHPLSSAMDQNESKPIGGNISICIRCHKPAIFTDGLQLRKPTADESLQIAQNPTVVQLQVLMAGFVPKKGDAK